MSAVIDVLQKIGIALFGGTYTPEGASAAVTVDGAITIFWEFLVQPTVLPFFLLGTGCALLLLAVRVVKGIFWGV